MIGALLCRGLRSGTLPTPLAVGLGEACRVAREEMEVRGEDCVVSVC